MKIISLFLVLLFQVQAYAECLGQDLNLVPESLNMMTSLVAEEDDVQHQLIMAAKNCNKEKIEEALEKGADLNKLGQAQLAADTYAIFKAAKNCSVEFFKYLMDKGARLDVARPLNETPILIVAIRWNQALAKYLIENDLIDINDSNQFDKSPLSVAVYEGRDDLIDLLLTKKNLDLNIATGVYNPLVRAVRHYKLDTFYKLLAHNKEIKGFNEDVLANAKDLLKKTDIPQQKEMLKALKAYKKEQRRLER